MAPVRKALGVRTAFNIVGPLLNAAGAQHVVVGVFQEVIYCWARLTIWVYVYREMCIQVGVWGICSGSD